MILLRLLETQENIHKYRHEMHDVAKIKGISHPEVIRISQKLDEQIVVLQRDLLSIQHHPEAIRISQKVDEQIVVLQQDLLSIQKLVYVK